jgi:rSAM/selenodomain-associated transferase 1
MTATRIVIFAKAPLAGLAKTRLIPALGADGAARLARYMLESTVATAMDADIGPVELCLTPAIDDPAWQKIPLPSAIAYSSQGDGDLGVRLARAAQRVIAQGEAVLLIGTDAPELSTAHLRQAAELLRKADATIFPTADGGYILLGLNRFHPSLFTDIPWSTEGVALTTQSRIDQLGWSTALGPRLHDIDEADDLKHLPAEWQERLQGELEMNMSGSEETSTHCRNS